jgi:hypothetical protein
MRRLARSVASLLSLVLLQLVLVESGYACRMPTTGPVGASEMAGMQMPAGADHASAPAPHDQQESPCRFPWAPNGCQTMAPCAPSALATASTGIASLAATRMAPAQLVLLAPTALSSAPELPPPRA